MRRLPVVFVAAASVLTLLASACRSTPSPRARGGTPPRATTSGGTPPKTNTEKDFDRDNFDHSTNIDNRWLPLTPGTQFVYEGKITEEKRRVSHRVVFIVTDLTKVIDGVRTQVIWDRDYDGGELGEGELSFFAQDNDGNVWLMGEYPEEYEEGKFAGAPDTWIAGLARARAGVLMRADPQVGTSSYLQGWAPDIDFADHAQVYETGQKSCVPFDCYEDVLVTEEWDPAEPAARQLKYYAAGVGNIRVGFAGNDSQQEDLVLVEVVHLDQQALMEVREAALAVERRANRVSKDLYGRTPPASQRLGNG